MNTKSQELANYLKNNNPLEATINIQKTADEAGFKFSNEDQVFLRLTEEVEELRYALGYDKNAIEDELGDVLVLTIKLAMILNLDIDNVLTRANDKFYQRFKLMESYVDKPMNEYSLEELMEFWIKAKKYLATI